MKCPKCEKQNKAGVKNCKYCDEKMPVRKKRVIKEKVVEQEVKKEPLIELSEEKQAVKKMIKKIKKMNKMVYVYAFLIISILLIILMLNEKMHTVTCKASNNSETEKYNIKLVIKQNNGEITGFKYITESITNSYDETLEARYKIIINELEKLDKYDEIVKSKLGSRNMKIEYNFSKENLEKTNDYISIDLTPYKDDVDSFVKMLEKEVGFDCK